MSTTPRTDAQTGRWNHLCQWEFISGASSVKTDFARKLETELTAARAEVERLKELGGGKIGVRLCEKGHGWIASGVPCYLCQHAKMEALAVERNAALKQREDLRAQLQAKEQELTEAKDRAEDSERIVRELVDFKGVTPTLIDRAKFAELLRQLAARDATIAGLRRALETVRDTAIATKDSLRSLPPTGGSVLIYETPERLRALACQALAQVPPPKPDALADTERIYPCGKCGKLRTKAEGGTTFTLCDDCWPKPDALAEWTATPPNEPGFYWMKRPDESLMVVCVAKSLLCYSTHGHIGSKRGSLQGQWSKAIHPKPDAGQARTDAP